MNQPSLSIGLAFPLERDDREKLDAGLRQLQPSGGYELISLREDEPLPPQCNVYIGLEMPPAGLEQHPRLEWIQDCSAGADFFLPVTTVQNGQVTLTSASGMHSVAIAEFVLGAMVNLSRHTDLLWEFVRKREWPAGRGRFATMVMRGQTVTILGYGSIGREVGRLTHAFGMSVIAVNRQGRATPDPGFHPAPDMGDPEGKLPAQWFASNQLPAAVATADFLVISCPLTKQTRSLVNRAVFAAMKPTACVINVGRGAVIEFDALRDSLQSGRLAGAALDVHPVEPLPADDPVYDLPNVQITPHMSGVMTGPENSRLLTDIYLQNLTRFVRKQPLLNVVHP